MTHVHCMCICIDVMAKDFESAKELLLGAVDTVLKMADHISSLAKIRTMLVHLHRHYSGTPQCGPPEKRTPRLSGRFVAVPNDLPL